MSERNPDINRTMTAQFVAPPQETALGAAAAGVEALSNAAVEYRQQKLTNSLEEELMAAQREALASMQSTEEVKPEGKPLTGDEAMSFEEFKQKMSDLQSAASQGTSTMTNLKIRQEQILRDYMARYPALRPRFQQAANGILGYSPMGAQVRAAEAAEGAAGGAGMHPILSMMLRAAESAGVDPTLYVRDPDEFWAQAQYKLYQNQRLTTLEDTNKIMAAERGLAFTTSQPQWAEFTGLLGEAVWSGQIMPLVRAFYDDLQLTPGMSYNDRQARIEAGMNDGRFREMELGLMRDKEQGIIQMYQHYVGSGIGMTNSQGLSVPVMDLSTFREHIAPIIAQYDFAIANINDPKAMEAMEMFNKARNERLISLFPDEVLLMSELGKLFNRDNTFSAILTQGDASNLGATFVTEFLTRMFGGRNGLGEGGPGSATVAPPAKDDTEVKPHAGDPKARLMTIDEVESRTGASRESIDKALGNIHEGLGTVWLDAWEETGNTVYAIGVWTLAKEYGNMVQAAYMQGGTMPSIETDNLMLDVISDPRFAVAALAGTVEGPQREAAMEDLIEQLRARGSSELNAAYGRIATTLDTTVAVARGSHGRSRAMTRQSLEHNVSNYVDFDLDHKNYTLTFKMRPDIPEYSKEVLENLVDRLNRDITLEHEQVIVRTAMASMHVLGISDPRGYRWALRTSFGMPEDK